MTAFSVTLSAIEFAVVMNVKPLFKNTKMTGTHYHPAPSEWMKFLNKKKHYEIQDPDGFYDNVSFAQSAKFD